MARRIDADRVKRRSRPPKDKTPANVETGARMVRKLGLRLRRITRPVDNRLSIPLSAAVVPKPLPVGSPHPQMEITVSFCRPQVELIGCVAATPQRGALAALMRFGRFSNGRKTRNPTFQPHRAAPFGRGFQGCAQPRPCEIPSGSAPDNLERLERTSGHAVGFPSGSRPSWGSALAAETGAKWAHLSGVAAAISCIQYRSRPAAIRRPRCCKTARAIPASSSC
jgi:hypothetical protein